MARPYVSKHRWLRLVKRSARAVMVRTGATYAALAVSVSRNERTVKRWFAADEPLYNLRAADIVAFAQNDKTRDFAIEMIKELEGLAHAEESTDPIAKPRP